MELAKAYVTVRADASNIPADMAGVETKVESSLERVARLGNKVGDMLSAAFGGNGMVMAFRTFLGGSTEVERALSSIGSFFSEGVKLAGQFEQTTIAFETMLGSARETEETMKSLTQFAAETPFEMPGILAAARGLIQFGERGDKLMNTMRFLGNAASAASVDFGFLALIFNQVRGVGKLLTQDFRQMSTRGIISIQDIANHFKVSIQEAEKMLSSGEISFQEFSDMLEGLSKEGGRFEDMMLNKSKSLLGLWSTLKDEWNIFKRELGTPIANTLKPILSIGIELVGVIRQLTMSVINGPLFKGFQDGFMNVVTVAGTVVGKLADMVAYVKDLLVNLSELSTIQVDAGGGGGAGGGGAGGGFGINLLEIGGSILGAGVAINILKYALGGLKSGVGALRGVASGILRVGKAAAVVVGPLDILVSGVAAWGKTWADVAESMTGAKLAWGPSHRKRMAEEAAAAKAAAESAKKAAEEKAEAEKYPYKAALEEVKSGEAKAGTEMKNYAEWLAVATKNGDVMASTTLRKLIDGLTGFSDAMKGANNELRILQGWSDRQLKMQEIADAGDKSKSGLAETKRQLGELKTLYEQIDALKERKELKAQADQLAKSFMTPLEKFKEEAEKIEKMREAGLITAEIYEAALDKAAGDMAQQQIAMQDSQKSMQDAIREASEGRMGIAEMHNRIQDALIKKDPANEQLEKMKEQIKLQHMGLKKDDLLIQAVKNIKPALLT